MARGVDRAWEALRPESAQLSLVHRPESIALTTAGTQARPADAKQDAKAEGSSGRHAGLQRRLEVVRRLGVPSDVFEASTAMDRGGMSTVTLRRDARLGRDVAVKVAALSNPHVRSAIAEEILARTLDEPQIAGQLDHPAVLAPHDVGVDADGSVFVVMPFARAGTLRDQAQAHGPDGWPRTCRLLMQAARALAHAHERGVLHRDVKPQNIFVGEHGDAYLADWGLALVLGRATPSESDAIHVQRGEDFDAGGRRAATVSDEAPGQIVGTPMYMSPEQAVGATLGPASDVFSLGATLFELLTGINRLPATRTAFRMLEETCSQPHPKVADRNPRAPRLVAAVCDRAVQFDPQLRHRDAGEFALALEDALARSR